MKISTILILTVMLCSSFASATNSSNTETNFTTIPKTYSEESRNQVNIAEKYLNSFQNLSAKFIQSDEHGSIQKGTFYLSRPDKMRWEYFDPNEILIIINNKDMVHYDKKLDQVSYFCSRNEFINLLTKSNINFKKDKVFVKKLRYDDSILKIVLGKNGTDSSLSLLFTKNPLKIRKFEIIEDSQNQIDITLLDIKQPDHMDNSLFEFTDHKYMR